MRVDFYTTTIQANITKERDLHEAAYTRYPDNTMWWCMVDLVSSSNFRLFHGPKEGYVRGETFFSLIRNVISPCTEIRCIKEIGDAVLLTSADPRAILECLILIDQVAYQISAIASTEKFPFAIRGAINFGVAKRLMRDKEDFLGSPIDTLSRIMSIKKEGCNLFIGEDAYIPSKEIVEEYRSFLNISNVKMMDNITSKNLMNPIYYRELTITRDSLLKYTDFFESWKKVAEQRRS